MRKVALVALVLAVGLAATSAYADRPAVDSAIIKPYLWADASGSTLTTVNDYPSLISIEDAQLGTTGWANRHNFRFSDNGGVSEAVFMNDHDFAVFADVTLSGDTNAEGGLSFSPWWSQDYDGVFMLRLDDGKIECWGGRLPYYNFSDPNGYDQWYTAGQTVRCGIVYTPHGLTEEDPATINYMLEIGGQTYWSGALPFGPRGENDPLIYGDWGIQNDARLGGYIVPKVDAGNPDAWARLDVGNVSYIPEPASLTLLALGGLVALRRRR